MTSDPYWFDPDRPTVRDADPDTSAAAARSITPSARGKACEDAYQHIWAAWPDGLTVAELVQRTGWDRGNTARRITDLRQAGRIRNSGRVRRGPSGRDGIVWTAT